MRAQILSAISEVRGCKDPKDVYALVRRKLGVPLAYEEVEPLIHSYARENNKVSEVSSGVTQEQPRRPSKVKVRKAAARHLKELTAALDGSRQVLNEDRYSKDGLSAVLCVSDTHFGEKIHDGTEETYNTEIATESLQSIFEQFKHAPELLGYELDEAVVLLCGDILDGEGIYALQAYQSDSTVFAQIGSATRMLWPALVSLLDVFPRVRVHCVPGNHGRASKYVDEMSNWDNVLYFGLRLLAESSPQADRIQVFTPRAMVETVPVREWSVHIRHIGVKQATTAGPGRKVQSWLDMHKADVMVFGHFHSPEMFSVGTRRVFKNGALPPQNEFAEKLGFFGDPGQWMFGMTDRHTVAFSKVLTPL